MGFSYSFAVVLLEIQDTLRQPPKAVGTMRKAIRIGVTGAFFFYLSVACTGCGCGLDGRMVGHG